MEYIIGGFIVGVFIVVVFFFLKKENQKLEEMVANLNEEQKNELSLTLL